MDFSNPAYDRLLSADRAYHLVFVVVGGLFMVLVLLFAVFARARARRAPRRTFERRTYATFAATSLALGLFLAVAFYANLTSVLNPRQTLAGTIFSPLGEAWLRAGNAELSPPLQRAIDERLAWQVPKAVICSVLLVAFVLLSTWLWRTLLRRSASGEARRGPARRLMLVAAVLSALACLLLMLMVLGNAEAATAPLFPTVIHG